MAGGLFLACARPLPDPYHCIGPLGVGVDGEVEASVCV